MYGDGDDPLAPDRRELLDRLEEACGAYARALGGRSLGAERRLLERRLAALRG
jgi:hypothetical protein